MIKARVYVGEELASQGLYIFPALPPVGSIIDIRDDVGDRQTLEVWCIEVIGMREADWEAAQEMGIPLEATLHCKST
jgi:hypothetical protein